MSYKRNAFPCSPAHATRVHCGPRRARAAWSSAPQSITNSNIFNVSFNWRPAADGRGSVEGRPRANHRRLHGPSCLE